MNAKFAVAIAVLRAHEGWEEWECIQVARKDNHDLWTLPGGKVDLGETSLLAAARELREETGFSLPGSAESLLGRFLPQGTIRDCSGYFTTFYLLDTTGLELPSEFQVADHEAPARWAPVRDVCLDPYNFYTRHLFEKLGLWP